MMSKSGTSPILLSLFALLLGAPLMAQVNESPALFGPRITQADILTGAKSYAQIRNHGLRVFSSPFNRLDGYGDGPMDPLDPTSPGGRPTLQGNGTFLRVNGLDAQSCMECHSVVSSATVPFTFGIGGVGTANNNAMFMPTDIDVDDESGNNFAHFNGRFINPPFLYGAGGVELLGKEMTQELQILKAQAQNNPGTAVSLVTKGVSFGTLTYQNGAFDYSGVEGINHDLVVRPFGRKGEFATTREFDTGALMFHFGMQPVELVGVNTDADNDGVVNEVLVGEVSSLSIFTTSLLPPKQAKRLSPEAQQGKNLFTSVGCADCHKPHLDTSSKWLPYSFPEVPTDPTANIYFSKRLDKAPTRFKNAPGGGVRVPLFSDLKRHDMGPGLAESFDPAMDAFFVTPRLWGIADTAPYLHDGRALHLTDAILMHGGEAQAVRDVFAALPTASKNAILAFLRSLRTPSPKEIAKGLNVSNL